MSRFLQREKKRQQIRQKAEGGDSEIVFADTGVDVRVELINLEPLDGKVVDLLRFPSLGMRDKTVSAMSFISLTASTDVDRSKFFRASRSPSGMRRRESGMSAFSLPAVTMENFPSPQ
ncbi:MAG: hypothetical protein M5R36_00905 [Deltaproteobacteria bacterium]|nr:hypothetical protein [Deltaproteobacteria bacterium]